MFELSDKFARGLNLKLETGGPLIKNTITLEQLLQKNQKKYLKKYTVGIWITGYSRIQIVESSPLVE